MLGLLQRLCAAAVRALSASGAGVSVMTKEGLRGLAVASDQASERIDELQFSLGEGPCMDAFSSSRPVLEPDLSGGGTARWPVYSAAAHAEGVRAVFAFPLQNNPTPVFAPHAQCPGTATSPQANPGFLCIYGGSPSGVYGLADGTANDRYGVMVYKSATANTWGLFYGTYAVTAA